MTLLLSPRSRANTEVRLRHSYRFLDEQSVVVHGLSGWDLAEVADLSAGTDPERRIESLVATCAGTLDGSPLSNDEVVMFSLGDFHLVLAAFSRLTFGNSVDLSQPCPAFDCGEPMSWSLLWSRLVELVDSSPEPVPGVAIGGRRHEIRPASVDDSAAIRRDDDPLRALLELCVDPSLDAVDDDGLKLLEAAFEELDPLASTTFNVPCTACGIAFRSELDLPAVVDDLWRAEDRHRAADDHLLATAYGWAPNDLAGLLPPARRRLVDALLDRWGT